MPGYEAKFVHPLLKRHECPICLFAMRNPVQTECGHLFCKECLSPVLRRRRPICPLDQEAISQDGIFPDNACRREILHLEVYCEYMVNGCSWTGALRDLDSHCEICEYREVQCTQCGQYIQFLHMRRHQDVDCPMRPEPCPHCKNDVPVQQMQSHCEIRSSREVQCTQCGQYIQFLFMRRHQDVDCPMRPEPCPHCKNDVPVQQMKSHCEICSSCEVQENQLLTRESFVLPFQNEIVDDTSIGQVTEVDGPDEQLTMKGGDCPLAEVDCPFKVYGCSFVSLRKNIPKHLEQYPVYHAQIRAEFFMELKLREEKNADTVQHLMERVSSLETRASAVERLQDAIEQRVSLLDDRKDRQVDQYGGRIESLEGQTVELHHDVSQLPDEAHTCISPYGGYSSTANLTSGYASEVDVLQNLGGASPLPTASGAMGPQRIETFYTKILDLDHRLERVQSSSIDQELHLQLIERASYNGTLIWKLDEFERRRKEAMEGVTLSLYSTPFFTSKHGYKMCARAYLNGDGLGKGTHLSFFFVIMRGPSDALLPWPFRQKVTLTLINQAGKKHQSDSFCPDPHSSSFQRPGRTEMNIASGCPMFIRIEHLLNGGFVKDDTIYLRVVVDTSDLPKLIP